MTESKRLTGENTHTIFVGGKPFMNYVTAVVMQFTVKGAEKVIVRSRGKFISRAVDIAEVVRNRFLKNQILVQNIEIGSEEFTNREGQLVNVSTLDVHLSKEGSGPIESSLQISNSVALKNKSQPEIVSKPTEPAKEPVADTENSVSEGLIVSKDEPPKNTESPIETESSSE